MPSGSGEVPSWRCFGGLPRGVLLAAADDDAAIAGPAASPPGPGGEIELGVERSPPRRRSREIGAGARPTMTGGDGEFDQTCGPGLGGKEGRPMGSWILEGEGGAPVVVVGERGCRGGGAKSGGGGAGGSRGALEVEMGIRR